MIKIISNTFNFKEPTIHLIGSKRRFEKRAAVHKDIEKYLNMHIKPERGRSKFHILFLGAGEYYSSNRNGDWFGEQDLINRHKTFEQFGHVFRHHVNKDPAKKYGDIEYVIYSLLMRRVEGIISLIDEKNQDVLEKYENNEDIPVSMAAKLKFDQCLCKDSEIFTADGIKNISSIILNMIFSFDFKIFFLFTRDFKIIIKNKIIMKETIKRNGNLVDSCLFIDKLIPSELSSCVSIIGSDCE